MCTVSWAISGASCRKDAMSSSTQNPRPCVATIKSVSCTHKSRIEVCGRFSWRDCQLSPLLKETHTAFSVPANSKPLRSESSRTVFAGEFSGKPLTINFHVFPPSVVR